MLLALDIGNTTIMAGLFARTPRHPAARQAMGRLDPPVAHGRFATSLSATVDGYAADLLGFVGKSGRGPVTDCVIASVVPGVEDAVAGAVEAAFGVSPVLLRNGEEAGRASGMEVITDSPAEVGADRVVNAFAASVMLGGPAVVVDFGTAVTIDYVDAGGRYVGGVIAPGMELSLDALALKAFRLSKVDIRRPESVIGRSTAEAMRSGLYYGYSGLVDGIIARIEEETGAGVKVIATGGAAHLVRGGSRYMDEIDEFLTLKGLSAIHGAKPSP